MQPGTCTTYVDRFSALASQLRCLNPVHVMYMLLSVIMFMFSSGKAGANPLLFRAFPCFSVLVITGETRTTLSYPVLFGEGRAPRGTTVSVIQA